MQLLDDDEDMADLYLTRKLLQAHHLDSPLLTLYSASGATVSSAASRKLARLSSVRSHGHASRRSSTTQSTSTIYNVEELEMLLEAYFMQVDASLNKLSLVSSRILHIVLTTRQRVYIQTVLESPFCKVLFKFTVN